VKPISTRIRFRQRTRRLLVVSAYLSLLAYSLALTAGVALLGRDVALVIGWGFIGLFVVLGLVLAYATGLLEGTPGNYLDERQRALRDRAHYVAFIPANWYILGIALSIGLANHWFQEPVFIVLVISLGLAILTLTGAYVAWLEPDPVDDEAFAAKERARADAS
jgi:hypothetical protein